MILFFPQYQAGYMPSSIPVGMPALRALWRNDPGFAEVPLQPTSATQPDTDRNVHYRAILTRQMRDALDIVDKAQPDFILTTGGDCGASFVPIAYMNEKYQGKIGVIWVDAHGDIHTPQTSPSGNYHGMVLRHLMGEIDFDIQPRLPLKPEQIAYLGLRDTEAEEDAVIERDGIPHFSAQEVMASDDPVSDVIAHFKQHGLTHLYLHVDCDVLDQDVFPYVHVPEPNGLSFDRLLDILQKLRATMPLAGCCLTEYAPRQAGEGLEVIKQIYTQGLGLSLPAANDAKTAIPPRRKAS